MAANGRTTSLLTGNRLPICYRIRHMIHPRPQKLTGAKVYVMRGDDQVIASGGKGQYMYTTSRWDPCKVDRVLEDRDEVKLGGVTLVARWTPGHTRGCTAWTWQVQEGEG